MNTFLWSYAFRDLFRQKTRSYLGILGVAVSLFLLTTVSFATDSISYSFINFVTADSGNQDMVLESRSYYGEPENHTEFFDYKSLQSNLSNQFAEIDYLLPRSLFDGVTGNFSDPKSQNYEYFRMCALDFQLEEEKNFGRFTNLHSELNISAGLPNNHCLVDRDFAAELNLQRNDQIQVWISQLNATMNLTISSTYSHELKFPEGRRRNILVDINWWNSLANNIRQNGSLPVKDWENKTNRLVIILKNAEEIYDTRDIEGTEKFISELGEDILKYIGLEQWKLDYPKLEILSVSEFVTLTLNIIFMVISFVSMLISGILINGILSTNVEERIREYGINRVLGAHNNYNLKLILIQAAILCIIGTTIGVIGSIFFTRGFIVPLIQDQLIESGTSTEVSFILRPTTLLISYAIGIGVSMAVSISPVIKVKRMNIVSSINPYRSSDEVYKLEKEGTVNGRLIAVGLIFALNGGFVYFLIPRIILSLQISLLAQVLIGTLLLFLIGVSLMALGLMPVILRVMIKLLTPLHRKLMNIIKTTVHRYQRRNMSTVIMFVLSFSFIIFTTSMVEIQSAQVGKLIQYNNGSDIVLEPDFYSLNSPTIEFKQELMEIEGIERVSATLASAGNLENIYSEQQKQFGVTLGDYVNFQYSQIRLYGIDSNYKDTIADEMQEFVRFTEGDPDRAFQEVFNRSAVNIIISTHVASDLGIHLNEDVRLTFLRGTEEFIMIAKIVGVAKNIPGMSQFREGTIGGSPASSETGSADTSQVGGEENNKGMSTGSMGGGVIISDFNYVKGMNVPQNTFINKMFVKIRNGYNHTKIALEIDKNFDDQYFLDIEVSNEDIAEAERSFLIIKYLFLSILIGTVIIALFGLLSSSYSSILERKREIGILRTLGLYGAGKVSVSKMFYLENLILLLSSSTSGGIIGFLMAYGLTENMTLFTNTPRIITLPWDIVLIIYGISILFLRVGMWFLMRKLRDKNLIEIFRETL